MPAIPLSRYYTFFALMLGGCALDLGTKNWVFARLGLPGPNVEWIWPDYFGLQTSLNQGALFGMGQGWGLLFAGFSCIALAGILYWLFFLRAAADWMLTVALGSISAGICGNCYDRLGLHGLAHNGKPILAVRDWILFQLSPTLTWPNFNLADSFLVCGAALLMWHAFTTPAVVPQTHAA